MTATVVGVRRRTFGLDRRVYVIRCPGCFHTEVRDPNLAQAISRRHECRETP